MNQELLAALTQAPGIAGYEDAVRAVAADALRPLVDDIRIDTLGNMVATRKGKGGPRIMLAAHIDPLAPSAGTPALQKALLSWDVSLQLAGRAGAARRAIEARSIR